MSVTLNLEITHGNAGDIFLDSTDGVDQSIRKICNFLEAGMVGARPVTTIKAQDNATTGAATVTLTSVAANTVFLVNGVPFTALSGTATAGNNEFDISGSDSADATALAAAINASTTTGVIGVVTASALSNVVTITSVDAARTANGVTLESLGVVAFGMATCAGVDAGDAITINGQAITAHATMAANNQFVVGATNAATATNLAAAINTSTTALINKHVRAVARSAVVYIFAIYGGVAGNAITLTTNDGTDLAVSGARLTGGTLAQYEGNPAGVALNVLGADGGTYRTTINGVDVDVTGTLGNDAATAATIVAAINTHTSPLIQGMVFAMDAGGGDIELTSIRGGHQGNAITIAVTGTGYIIVGGFSRLTGGAAPTALAFAGGLLTPLQSGVRLTGGGSDTQLSWTL